MKTVTAAAAWRVRPSSNQSATGARSQKRYLVCTHAGDTLSPSLMSSFDQGAHMIDLFNEAGLDIFVPGNHEFDFGKDVYFERMKEARFAILAANLKDRGGATPPLHKESLAFEADGIKLALTGAAYRDTPTSSRPGFLATIPTIVAAKSARGRGRFHRGHRACSPVLANIERGSKSRSTSKSPRLSRRSTAAPIACACVNARSAILLPMRCKASAAEIAIINGGGIQGNRLYPAGTKLIKRDVLDELPFGNKTILIVVMGSVIFGTSAWILERGATGL